MAVDPDLLRNLRTFLERLGENLPANETTVLYMGGGAAILIAYQGQLRKFTPRSRITPTTKKSSTSR
jgi:hypothetical protein